MKKFLVVSYVFISQILFAQNVPYDFESALKYSYNFTFEGNNYVPDKMQNNNFQSDNVLSVMQSRYDRGYYFVTGESSKLFHLQLINKKNTAYIKSFIEGLKPTLASQFNNIDWALSENVSWGYRLITHYINGQWKSGENPTTNPIVDEIKLLQKINSEYFRLKNNNLDGFYNTKRWNDIKNLLIELENCEISEIPKLGQKYNIY